MNSVNPCSPFGDTSGICGVTKFILPMELFSPKCVSFWDIKIFVNPFYVEDMSFDQIWNYICIDAIDLLPDKSVPTKRVMPVSISSFVDVPPKAKTNEFGVSTKIKRMEYFHFEHTTQEVFVLVDKTMSNPKTDVAAYVSAVKEMSKVLGTKGVGIVMKRPSKKQRNLDITSPKFGIDGKYLEDKVEKETRWVVKEVINGVVIEKKVLTERSTRSGKSHQSEKNENQFEIFDTTRYGI